MGRFVPYRSPGSFGFNVDLWRVRRDASRIERVDPEAYGSMTIVCNQDTAVKRTISIKTSDLDLFTPFQDYLMPVLTISDPEGNTISGPQGVFMVMPPNTNADHSSREGTVEGQDLFQLFVMDTSPQGWAPPGVDRGQLIRSAVSEHGFGLGQIQIPDFGVTMSDYKAWEPGTTVADRITDHAVNSNWYQPWFALNGTLVTKPYGPLTGLSPSVVFSNRDEFSAADIEGVIVGTPDWKRLANRVTVRKLGSQDEPSIWWTQADQNSDSPVSFKNLGLWIGKVVDNADLVDEEQARAQAQALLSESSSHYMKLSVPTFPVIDAELHQTVELDIWHGNTPIYTGAFWRTGYTLTLDGSRTKMVQELARVEPWI